MRTNRAMRIFAAVLILLSPAPGLAGEVRMNPELRGMWTSGEVTVEGIRTNLTLTFNSDGTMVFDERHDSGTTNQKLRFSVDGDVILLFPLAGGDDGEDALEFPFRLQGDRLYLILDEHEIALSPVGGGTKSGGGAVKTERRDPPPEKKETVELKERKKGGANTPDSLAGTWNSGPLSYPDGERSLSFSFRDQDAVAIMTTRGGKTHRTEGTYRIDDGSLVVTNAAGKEARFPFSLRGLDGALVVTFDNEKIPLKKSAAD